jgi:hypothetical protein
MLETQIAQIALALPHPNKGSFLGQLAIPLKENTKVVITRFGKTSPEHKTKSKRAVPSNPTEKEDEG